MDILPMKLICALFLSVLLAAGGLAARAQAVYAATAPQLSITAGGMASISQPDYFGGYACVPASCVSPTAIYPVAGASDAALFGVGAYVDVRLTRWVQIEAEGRWQRFNAFQGITQDNYLIGPRIPVYRFDAPLLHHPATLYAKALGGYSKMNFGPSFFNGTGKFTDIAFGGGVDIKLTKKLSFRLIDAEYQYWPSWSNSKLTPYGASMGIGYKVF
jgi:hypothetical protein